MVDGLLVVGLVVRHSVTGLVIVALVVAGCAVASGVHPDLALRGRVAGALYADPVLQVQDLRVEAAGGTVYLFGRVPDATHQARAADLARRAGARGVENQLRVPAPPRASQECTIPGGWVPGPAGAVFQGQPECD